MSRCGNFLQWPNKLLIVSVGALIEIFGLVVCPQIFSSSHCSVLGLMLESGLFAVCRHGLL